MASRSSRKKALTFLLLLGIISLLSDFTHEGARSIYGPYLSLLGVSAFVVSFTSGLGEFIGQSLRIVTGFIADKTKKYWTMMFIGYALNLLVIPLLMFVQPSIWQVAIILILLERVGKGIRAPAKSALTSFTTSHFGAGKSFALQEAMDQIGAFLGPIFVYTALVLNKGSELNGYQLAFGLLGIFAILTLVVIIISRIKYPHPDELETKPVLNRAINQKAFILYMLAIIFIAFGFIDYPVLAFHLEKLQIIPVIYIPLLYALAMGVDAAAAVLFGLYFDKKGVQSLMIAVVVSSFIAPVFFIIDGVLGAILGLVLWGIGMGAQESILKAVISTLVSKDKRATAYGIFYTVFGLAWFIGSLLVGLLYEYNLMYLVIFSSLMEGVAVIFLVIYQRQIKQESNT